MCRFDRLIHFPDSKARGSGAPPLHHVWLVLLAKIVRAGIHKNIIVMLVSGIVATIGYNIIPFKAYIIFAALSALIVSALLTLIDLKKK